jgi:S-adenosyl-L-methionine hydrolase (adenosine-forming)
MAALGLVTFLSDFGWSGGYVAACEAAVMRVSRDLRVAHIDHTVPAGDVAAGALVLARVAPLYPEAVHLAVVDPGVGTSRRPLAVAATRGDFLVGPDNGLLLSAAEALGGVRTVWELDVTALRSSAGLPPEDVSSTFHGRDVFSPAAALLATGADPGALGRPVEIPSLCRLPSASARSSELGVAAAVIEVDRFGNAGLGLKFADLPGRDAYGAAFVVEAGDGDALTRRARVVRTYGDLTVGELGLVCDSWGHVALTLNGASAAEFLGLKPGVTVRLTLVKEDVDGR